MKFCPIASGSSGNSLYIGTEYTNILIDAGLSGKRIKTGLDELNVDGRDIDAIFITHEHKDHIKGAGILSRRYDIPIYATFGTWEGMKEEIGAVAPKNIKYVYDGENCVINDICVRPFEISHDAAEPVGFNIFAQDHKISVATDMGHVSERVKECIADSEILLLEANHDVQMLKKGPYPWYLKQRILGDKGHISNEAAGNVLCEIMSGILKYVYLGHLSEENNIPYLAFETVEEILKKSNIKLGGALKMDLASRYSNSRVIEL